MSKTSVAKRYAVAFFRLAKEKEFLIEAEQQLRLVNEVLTDNPEIDDVLHHPKISAEKKKEIFRQSFGQVVSSVVMNVLFVMIDQRREDAIQDMITTFISLTNEDQGIADAKVYTVKPLSEDDAKAVSQVFAEKVGKKQLRVTNIIDNEIIGGIKIRIGDRIFDGTVKGQLQRLERQLISGNVRR